MNNFSFSSEAVYIYTYIHVELVNVPKCYYVYTEILQCVLLLVTSSMHFGPKAIEISSSSYETKMRILALPIQTSLSQDDTIIPQAVYDYIANYADSRK